MHQTITVSLPRDVLRKIERVQKRENRSPSNLIGEALDRFFSLRAVRASNADLAAMRRARAEIKAGKFVTLEQAPHGLDASDRKTRRKRTRKNPG
jgi:predicted transcriptional regulator